MDQARNSELASWTKHEIPSLLVEKPCNDCGPITEFRAWSDVGEHCHMSSIQSSIYGVVGPHATPFAGLVCRLSVIRTTSLLPLLQRGWRCGLPNASVPAHSKNLSVGAPSFGPFWYVFCTPLLGDPHVPHGHHRFLVACNDGIQWAG